MKEKITALATQKDNPLTVVDDGSWRVVDTNPPYLIVHHKHPLGARAKMDRAKEFAKSYMEDRVEEFKASVTPNPYGEE